MNKLLAIIKREYVQRVRSKMFILITLMAPVVLSFFGAVPALMLSINPGGPTKIAVVDQTGKLYQGLQDSLLEEAEESKSGRGQVDASLPRGKGEEVRLGDKDEISVDLRQVDAGTRSLDQIKSELDDRVRAKQLDGYLILPASVFDDGKAEFFSTNPGDVFSRRFIQKALTRAVREQRLKDAHIDAKRVEEFSKPAELRAVKVGETGTEHDSGEGFLLVFLVGFVMYLTILMYGQVILGAVIEEKETRIAEILFSSAKPFVLMTGKLIGVSLVALTQLAIWGLAFGAFLIYGVRALGAQGLPIYVPHIPAINYLYFVLFFLLGYFIYSTIYALIGSMVTTAQEGGQLAMPVILLLVIGFYLFLPVSRSPDSSFAFWVSMLPFFSPMTMLVRITTQTPPLWQILLSLLIGFGTVALLTWLAGRIYRVGMLMYGKKATIPEVMRWVRQA